jgi:hypothetical protein
MVIYASDVGISDVVAEDDVGRLGGSTGATGLAAEARAAERLRAAVRAGNEDRSMCYAFCPFSFCSMPKFLSTPRHNVKKCEICIFSLTFLRCSS